MRRTPLLLVLAVAALLAACTPAPSGPPVASLRAPSGAAPSLPASPPPTGAPDAGADTAPPPDSSSPGGVPPSGEDPTGGVPPAGDAPAGGAQPQRRLDDSPEREAALWNAYHQCLLDHGAQRNTAREAAAAPAGAPGPEIISVLDPVPAEAEAACTHAFPLMPPELDPDRNPHYRDDFLAQVACMQDRGAPVHLTKDSGDPTLPSWTYDDGAQVPADLAQIEHDCELEAFGGTP
ncbi:hypothetical protein [Xylanimonas protaetiae]|uniref:Uncharacterized protein n=1 Tax=Xylanimonas protaetiae TaxID=2509457 RepID=A0A4P6F0R4_9MICO|nr:hypothetical protein [Xylanimonas protaetiae]QAY68665.1 hypothetical protein ET471_00240 [Xylanimonas protaetiae]